MSKLLASMTVAGALVLAGLCLPAAAAPASHDKGVSNGAVLISAKEDVAARKRRRTVRRYRAVRVYPAPSYYGYYGPTYYERPYYRPAPPFFGIGGWW